jgi:Protein of unknown function (DUF2829)
MNIGWAIAHMQSTIGSGKPCRRTAWPIDWSIAIQKPDANSKMTEPYIYITMGKKLVAWIPTQSDLLADDYEWAT